MNSYQQAKNLPGIYYDLTEGGFLEIPLRMGLVTNVDFIRRTFDAQGIFIKDEMMQDYRENPQNYATNPEKDSAFDRNISNWQAWLKHFNRLKFYAPDNLKIGDILFFADQTMGLYISDEKILYAAKKEKKVIAITLDNAISAYGTVQQIGRVLIDQ